MDIETIRARVRTGNYIISFTHTEKVRLRKIQAREIEEAVYSGIIIEPYLDDPRGESCLIFGFTSQKRPLHVVCGKLEDEAILVITAYQPDPGEWESDWKTRKQRG
jgi:hypothetical protein